MPDLLLDALPVIDLLEITGNTSAVALLTERDQSSVSRIYRQASDRLGLQFHKRQNGDYRASANQALLQELRRFSQRLRLLHQPPSLRWLSLPWSPSPGDGTAQPHPLRHGWLGSRRLCELLRDHLLDLAVVPGFELLPEPPAPDAVPVEVLLSGGSLVALPLLRQPLQVAAPSGHPLHDPSTPSGELDLSPWPLRLIEAEGSPSARRRQQLQARGLAVAHGPDHHTPGAAPLHLLPTLELERIQGPQDLRPLAVASGLEDWDVLILRRDLREEAAVVALVEALVEAYRRQFARRSDLQLLR
jgi:hypothetical protein